MPFIGRRIRGDRSFRRLLKQMPDAIKKEMFAMFEETGDKLVTAIQAAAPVGRARKGHPGGETKRAISKRIYESILKMRVGLIGKPINRRLFYARIVEVGVRAQTVNIVPHGLTARVRAAGGRSNRYKALAVALGVRGAKTRDIKARAPRPFVLTPTTKQIRNTMGGELNTYWDRVLKRASAGATDD